MDSNMGPKAVLKHGQLQRGTGSLIGSGLLQYWIQNEKKRRKKNDFWAASILWKATDTSTCPEGLKSREGDDKFHVFAAHCGASWEKITSGQAGTLAWSFSSICSSKCARCWKVPHPCLDTPWKGTWLSRSVSCCCHCCSQTMGLCIWTPAQLQAQGELRDAASAWGFLFLDQKVTFRTTKMKNYFILKCVPLSRSFTDEGTRIRFILRRRILPLRFFYLVPWNQEPIPIPLHFTAVFKENKEGTCMQHTLDSKITFIFDPQLIPAFWNPQTDEIYSTRGIALLY